MKKKIVILLIISFLIVVIGISIFVSFEKFSTLNPISTISGIIQVSITDKKYVIIQNKPWKVIIAKSEYNNKNAQEMLADYMLEMGYVEVERMGSLITYSNGKDIERIFFRVNGYYSVWEWT